jgi:hypothetical protein
MPRAYLVSATLLVAGAAIAAVTVSSSSSRSSSADASTLALDLSNTRLLGPGARFRPAARALTGAPIGSLRCRPAAQSSYGAHIELFAANHEVLVPAGIGIAGARHHGSFVTSGRCRYPLSTVDPTGVVRVRAATTLAPTVGQLFVLWGQPLSRFRLTSFAGAIRAFVDGRAWNADPRAIPLARHAQVVLEVGPAVAPHAFYLFPAGL